MGTGVAYIRKSRDIPVMVGVAPVKPDTRRFLMSG
jgi:hypothetical protein